MTTTTNPNTADHRRVMIAIMVSVYARPRRNPVSKAQRLRAAGRLAMVYARTFRTRGLGQPDTYFEALDAAREVNRRCRREAESVLTDYLWDYNNAVFRAVGEQRERERKAGSTKS